MRIFSNIALRKKREESFSSDEICFHLGFRKKQKLFYNLPFFDIITWGLETLDWYKIVK